VELPRDHPPAHPGDRREDAELKDDRRPSLALDRALQRRLVRAVLPRSGTEVDRKKRRREVQRLQPSGVAFWREPVAFRILFVRSESGVMIEMPLRELRRRDSARHRIEKTEHAIR